MKFEANGEHVDVIGLSKRVLYHGGSEEFFTSIPYLTSAYFSPLNPIFLISMKNPWALNERPHWLLRDGALPLAHFFKAIPEPGRITSHFFVERSLFNIVPPAWKKLVSTYRVVCLESDPLPKRKLLFGGFFADGECDEEFEAMLKSSKLPEELGAQDCCCFPFKPIFGRYSETIYFEAVRSLLGRFGTKFQTIDWGRILYRSNFSGVELFPLASKIWVADPFYVQICLSRGGAMKSDALEPGETWIPLSPSHGYAVGGPRPGEFVETKGMEKLNRSSLPYWYDNWLSQFTKSFQEQCSVPY